MTSETPESTALPDEEEGVEEGIDAEKVPLDSHPLEVEGQKGEGEESAFKR